MKAVFIHRTGGPEVVEVGERPRPSPRGRQVLVEVRAAGVNPRDWLIRAGRYPFQRFLPAFPLVLGSDVSGVVVDTGPRASRFQVGDAVFGMQPFGGGFGGFAELVAIDERALAVRPEALSDIEAAALPCAGLTALQSLRDLGRLGRGERVIVTGASGGVGSFGVQIAKILGVEVTAVGSGPNRELVTSLGADRFVDYGEARFEDVVTDQHLVFDAAGRSSLGRCRRVLRPGGRYVTTVPSAATIAVSTVSPLLRLLTFGRARSAHVVLVRARGDDLALLASWAAEGRLRSVVEEVFPLDEVQAAFARSKTWHTRGKLVLRIAAAA